MSTLSLFKTDQKEVYREIRNFLAGRMVGATRDRALLDEVVKCLFCRFYDLKRGDEYATATDSVELAKHYRKVFASLRTSLPEVFEADDEILLDPPSIAFVHEKLSDVDLADASRDPFGDLFEVFVGTGVREEEGQFFTPQNGVDLLVSLVNPRPGERIIDPACGAGGFLGAAAAHLAGLGATDAQIAASVVGVEKDAYLAKLARTRLSLTTLEPSRVACGDSLAWRGVGGDPLDVEDGGYDVVLTNPPFGKKIVAASKAVQKGFLLGHKWSRDKTSGEYQRTSTLPRSMPPQVLFVERCLDLLRPGGRLGVVLPESLVTSGRYGHVVRFMLDRAHLRAVLGMPENFFKTSGKGGTHTKACLLYLEKHDSKEALSSRVFMAEAEHCGHDSRGKPTERDDLPAILDSYRAAEAGHLAPEDETTLGYSLAEEDIEGTVLSPRYYDPSVRSAMSALAKTHHLLRIGDLVDRGALAITTGHEVGKAAYGTGDVPFVRTSDLSNWEIKIDPKHGVSRSIYESYRKKQDVQPEDILMVRDGTYLIGTCAMVTEYDREIVFQSHVYKIRVLDPDVISPYVLLASLTSGVVQDQIRSKRFTQDIIDSLGSRIVDITVPVPRDEEHRQRIEDKVQTAISDRIEARELARQAAAEVASVELPV